MDKFFNLKDFHVEPKHPSEKSLRRWRSACTIVKNPKRRFCMVADLDRRSEVEKKKRQIQEVSLQDKGTQGKQSILRLEQENSLLDQFEPDNIVQYLGTDRVFVHLYPQCL